MTEEDSLHWWKKRALHMVETQIMAGGVKDQRVLNVMANTPRHCFVPPEFVHQAYDDGPLSIGNEQTISQPLIVAMMTELLDLNGSERVLEIGTGSGYQAAILSQLVDSVYSIEIIPSLAEMAASRLDSLNLKNVKVKCGDGYQGWPEHAPFDAIIVTAAPPEIPKELINQLKVGGRMVIPVGGNAQELQLVRKTDKGVEVERVTGVMFVPMVRGKD